MEILRKEMKLKGFSVIRLGKEINIHPTNIYGWFSGKFLPNASSVKKLKSLGFSDTAVLDPSKDVEV